MSGGVAGTKSNFGFFGLSKKKTTRTRTGTLIGSPTNAERAAETTAARHAGRNFDASINLPPPTLRLDPCGAGFPMTEKLKLFATKNLSHNRVDY